jgi:hypothetical protein
MVVEFVDWLCSFLSKKCNYCFYVGSFCQGPLIGI